MTFMPQKLVHVYYNQQLVGRLLLQNRQIFFEYDQAFLSTGLELSPLKLPLKPGVITSNDSTFGGLFGVFNDSLPDGWGRLLLDRKMHQIGYNPASLSALDRLCLVGGNGMGALSYHPESLISKESVSNDLDEIDYEIQQTMQESELYLDQLLILSGSSAGARPKIILPIAGEQWLIKFRSSFDPRDISSIEYAYHLMAKEAGLNLPEAKIFPSKKGPGFFGVKRFDIHHNQKLHMHSIAGLLHADHRDPSLDYTTIIKATSYLTRDSKECEVQFRNAVFNVLSHNRDDHSKNFSFLMDESGTWKVSPAYDLTFSSGPSGEHATTILGEGKNPTQHHLLELAKIADIDKTKALEIIEQVRNAVQQWPHFASNAGVSQLQKKNIGHVLSTACKA